MKLLGQDVAKPSWFRGLFRGLFWATAPLLGIVALGLGLPSAIPSYAARHGKARPAAALAFAPQDADEENIKKDTPPVPVGEIIRRFAQHESDFRVARGQYTYTQDVLVREAEPDGGEYQVVTDVVFTPAGKRYEHDTYDPAPTLRYLTLSPEDERDLQDIQPFVLTTEELPKYDVEYLGSEQVDELHTYVFRVSPKRIDKKQRYFQGTVWVDNHDFAVVKSYGKAVPDVGDQQFPHFTTYRENIEGTFWFPTYTHADDILRFKTGDVHVQMTVRYKNYKRFGSTVRIGESKTLDGAPVGTPPPKK